MESMNYLVKLARVFAALVTLLGVLPLALPAAATADEDVIFDGSGWGHGIGLSQYGSKSMAVEGWTAEQIVEYYFTDADVVDLSQAVSGWLVDDPEPLWVNLISTTHNVSFRSTGGTLTFCQQEPASVGLMSLENNGGEHSLYVELLERRLSDLDDLDFDPGPIDGWFDSDTDLAVRAFQTAEGLGVDGEVGNNTKNALWPLDSGDRCVIETPLDSTARTLTPNEDGSECLFDGAFASGGCVGSVRGLSVGDRLVIPERRVRNGSAIELAHGDIRVRPDRDSSSGNFEGIHVVLEVGIDDYVYGIDETILSWTSVANEALLAQAIASRAYAVGTAKGKGPENGPENGFSSSRKDSCWCHLWSSSLSQVFAGYYAETLLSGVWRAAADATAGKVLEHPTAGLVTAFFGSSNGGATEANEDVWGGSPVPYLRSVPDPWSLDISGPYPNPYANWSYQYTPGYVAGKLGFDQLVGVGVTQRNQSGSARTVRFVGLIGEAVVIVDKTGGWVDSRFGLRSRYFDVAWGDISGEQPPPPPPPPPTPQFDDISGNVFENAINWLAAEKITLGCNPPANTRFCPSTEVTRGEMAVFISRAMGLPSPVGDHFSDDKGKFYESAANRLYEAGITTGCGGGRFCGDQLLPREQMAVFMDRALGLPATSVDYFIDDENSPFEVSINRIGEARITVGCNPPTNDRFCPNDHVTRGQMAAFFKRAWGR
jgi:SpoIID/LytB domain protein